MNTAEIDPCVCAPDFCVGVYGESDTCKACSALDPELPCLHDPEFPRASPALAAERPTTGQEEA